MDYSRGNPDCTIFTYPQCYISGTESLHYATFHSVTSLVLKWETSLDDTEVNTVQTMHKVCVNRNNKGTNEGALPTESKTLPAESQRSKSSQFHSTV